jgi:hypothetical protein
VVGANMPKPQGFDVYDNYNIYKFSQNPELSEQYRSSVVSAYYCV